MNYNETQSFQPCSPSLWLLFYYIIPYRPIHVDPHDLIMQNDMIHRNTHNVASNVTIFSIKITSLEKKLHILLELNFIWYFFVFNHVCHSTMFILVQ